MIESVIKTHLNSQLENPAYLEKPDPAPARYVLIEKIGGGKSNHLHSSTYTFQSYAESLYQAAVLNDAVKAAVEGLEALDEIGGVHLNSDYNFTATETKEYRYQAVYDIKHY